MSDRPHWYRDPTTNEKKPVHPERRYKKTLWSRVVQRIKQLGGK